jgi:hypothetical protein
MMTNIMEAKAMKAEQIEPYMFAGLQRYCEFDRSDPFTYARGLAHIRQELCGACEKPDLKWTWKDARGKSTGSIVGPEAGTPGHYDARRISLEAWGNVTRL